MQQKATNPSRQRQSSKYRNSLLGTSGFCLLAALCHDHVPLDQPIDLINVAFETAIATATPTVHSSLELSPLNNSKLDCDNPFSLSPDRRAAHYYLTWLVDTGLADCDLRLACTIAT